MEKNPELGATNCSGFYIDEEGQEIGQYQQCNMPREKLLKELYCHNCIKVLSGALIKRECFDKVGLFDERLAVAEDWDFWVRLCEQFGFMGSDLELVRYRVRSKSQSSQARRNLENELLFLNKLFSDPSRKISFWARRKAFSRRYQAAAIAFREVKDRSGALRSILRSIYFYPLFNKWTFALIAYGLLGS
jgi:GT2 family glycosyltransferase